MSGGPRRLDCAATISSVMLKYTPMAPALVREPFHRGWVYEEKVDRAVSKLSARTLGARWRGGDQAGKVEARLR